MVGTEESEGGQGRGRLVPSPVPLGERYKGAVWPLSQLPANNGFHAK